MSRREHVVRMLGYANTTLRDGRQVKTLVEQEEPKYIKGIRLMAAAEELARFVGPEPAVYADGEPEAL